nr:hypothetical protein [Microbacterium mangrovi]
MDDDGSWKGHAYDRYLARYDRQLLHWQHTGEHLTAGAHALYTYADALEWAQHEADRAITMWDEAEALGIAAMAAHQEQVRRLRAGQGMRSLTLDVPFQDPSGTAHQAARDVLFHARMTLDVFARDCTAALDEAAAAAKMPLTQTERQSAVQATATRLFVDVVVQPFQSLMDFLSTAARTLGQHPDILLELLGGAALVVGGAAVTVGGGGVSVTGAGALAGIPAAAQGAGLAAAGAGMIGDATGRWLSEAERNHGIDRGDGRDERGHWAKGQEKKPWEDKEKEGLENVARARKVKVIRNKVRANFDGSPQAGGRYYDGLFKNPDGTYTAVEVKSGSAVERYSSSSSTQREFDDAVNAGTPARATLNGERISITKVVKELLK